MAFPLRIVFGVSKQEKPNILSGVGVSKKYYKKAHDRNYVKRVLRETFRQNQHTLNNFVETNNIELHFFLMYIDKTLPEYENIQKKMPIILDKLINQIILEINATQNS